MRPSPYEPAILAFLADGRPRTLAEISAAAGCRNASRVVGKLQWSLRVRRLPVKLAKETKKNGRRNVVCWRIIGPSKERRALIDKGKTAENSIFTTKNFHGMEGKRNRAILEGENVADSRLTVCLVDKPLLEAIAILENRSVADCVRDALAGWIEGKAKYHRLGRFRKA